MKLALVSLALLAVSCGGQPVGYRALPAPPASAWPTAFGDAAHTSPTTATGPQTGRLRWQRELEGAVVPGPVVGADGSVLAASNGGVLHALDPATGRDRWTYDGGGSYGVDTSTSPAVLGDGTVLWPGPGQQLHALSATGAPLWTLQLDGFVLSPAVVGSRVYVADMAGTLLALDVTPTSHEVAWRLALGGPSYGSPAVAPDGRILTTHDRDVVAVTDRGDRAEVAWRFRTKDLVEVSPAVAPDGTVVVGTNADVQYGLTPDGEVRWRYDRGDWTYSSAVVVRGKAYFGDHLGYLDVVDAATGRELRRHLGIPKARGTTSAGTGVWTAPLVDARDNVYFGTAAGHVYGFAADGRRLFDVDRGSVVASYPALTADGTLLIGDSGGTLSAFQDQP